MWVKKGILKGIGAITATTIILNVVAQSLAWNSDNLSDPIETYLVDEGMDPRVLGGVQNKNIRVWHDNFSGYVASRTKIHNTLLRRSWQEANFFEKPVVVVKSAFNINSDVLRATIESIRFSSSNVSAKYFSEGSHLDPGNPAYAYFGNEESSDPDRNLFRLTLREKEAVRYYIHAHEFAHNDQTAADKGSLQMMAREIEADLHGIDIAQTIFPDVNIIQLVKYTRMWHFLNYTEGSEVIDHNTALAIDTRERGLPDYTTEQLHDAYLKARPFIRKAMHGLYERYEGKAANFQAMLDEMEKESGPARRMQEMVFETLAFQIGREACGPEYVLPSNFDILTFSRLHFSENPPAIVPQCQPA